MMDLGGLWAYALVFLTAQERHAGTMISLFACLCPEKMNHGKRRNLDNELLLPRYITNPWCDNDPLILRLIYIFDKWPLHKVKNSHWTQRKDPSSLYWSDLLIGSCSATYWNQRHRENSSCYAQPCHKELVCDNTAKLCWKNL